MPIFIEKNKQERWWRVDIKLIQNRIELLSKAQEELRFDRVQRAEELRNSEVYRGLTDKIDQLKNERECIVHKNLLIAKYDKKIKDLNEEIRDLKQMLDYELLGYHKTTDQNQIEDASGHIYKITFHSIIKKTNQPNLL